MMIREAGEPPDSPILCEVSEAYELLNRGQTDLLMPAAFAFTHNVSDWGYRRCTPLSDE